MKFVLACVACVGITVVQCASAVPYASALSAQDATSADVVFARAFVCPDPSAPLAQRKAGLKKFMDWVGAYHGNWTIAHVIAFRTRLLEAHDCTATLQAIRENDAAAATRQAAALTAKAAAGDAAAQNELGLMYAQGRGVPQDFEQAFAWSHKAAVQSNAAAEVRVCFAYATGRGVARDAAKAFKWCTQAADRGSAPGAYGLALLYEHGNGTPRNMNRAVAWYRKAAAQGFAPAEFNLGIAYLRGDGVPRDDAKGVALYRAAAEHGSADAQSNLAYLYMTGGGGLPRDDAQAVKWATLAANRGNAGAQNTLGALYSNGQGVAKDDVAAAKWFMLVRGPGETAAACNLGKLEARMKPAQIKAARDAAQTWQTARGITDVTTNAPLQPSACPNFGNQYGTAAFTTEQAGRNAAGHLLDAEFGKVPLSDVASRGFAPDTPVDPNQAENWAHGVEVYLQLRGYAGFAADVGAVGDAEFNAFLDAMTNQEGRTNMGSTSYANLAAARSPVAATAAVAPLPQTVVLPQTAAIKAWSTGQPFRVTAATSADLHGSSTEGAPAFVLAMRNGMGGWRQVFTAALPPVAASMPAADRARIAWFLINGDWIAVPRGWKVQSAINAVTPTWGATFVAPGGADHGWLAVGGAGPGTSEAFSGTEGYFPDAYRLYDRVIPGALARDPALSPEPDSLTHPARCVARVTYKSGALAVTGVKVFQPATDGIDRSPYVHSYFVAVPASDTALTKALAVMFQKQHPVMDCRAASVPAALPAIGARRG